MTTQTTTKDIKLAMLRADLRVEILDAELQFAERIAKQCMALFKAECTVSKPEEAEVLEQIIEAITEGDLLEQFADCKDFSMRRYLKLRDGFCFCERCDEFIGLEWSADAQRAYDFQREMGNEYAAYDEPLVCCVCEDEVEAEIQSDAAEDAHRHTHPSHYRS